MPKTDPHPPPRGDALNAVLRAAFDEGVDEGDRGFADSDAETSFRFHHFRDTLLNRLERAADGKRTRPFLAPDAALERLALLDSEVTWTWMREAFDAGVRAGDDELAGQPEECALAYAEFLQGLWRRITQPSRPAARTPSASGDPRGVPPETGPATGTVQRQSDKSPRRPR